MLPSDRPLSGPDLSHVPQTSAGDTRIHANFRSRFLAAERDLIVYLPPGYDEGDGRRYPVLYLQDGQNLFDGATAFVPGQDWRVGRTADELIAAGEVRPLIIVGIYNTGRTRADEYTPTFDARFKVGGGADLYGRLIVEELIPFIHGLYPAAGAADVTGLGGSSLGGLVSLYVGIRYPHVFGRLALLSPSVWWGGRTILREVRALGGKTGSRVWLDMGTGEGTAAVRDARHLRDALKQKGWREGEDLNYFEDEGAGHNELAWAGRVAAFLKYLYPPL